MITEKRRKERFAVPLWCVFLTALFTLGGCAPNNVFVLMPEPDGKVGELTVSNEKGSQTIRQAGTGVVVEDPQSAPRQPTLLARSEIESIFGGAMDAEPDPPRVFHIFFLSGSTELTPASMKKLPAIMESIRERQSLDISVVGHSDRKGAEELNYKLSLERARHVRDILVESGVDPDIINTTSHGEENPLIPTADNVSEPQNRRVEVTIR